MLNDLPADMEVLEELNISCLDPMLKDYVFSSFFLARLLDKTLKEKNELAKENEALKAKLGDYDNLKRTFEELKKTIDAMGGGPAASDEPVMSEGAEAPDMKPLGFMGRNRQELEGMLEGTEEAVTDTDELASSVEALLNNMDGAAEIPLGEEPSLGDVTLGDVALDGVALEEVSLDAGAPAEEAAASDEDLLKALADAPAEEVSLEAEGGENLEASVDELLSGLADMPAEEVPADISVDELVAGAEAILGETGEAAAIAEEAVAVEEPVVEEVPVVEEAPVEAVAEEPVAVEAPAEEVAADIDIAALASETEALLNEAEAAADVAEASPEEIAAAMEALAGAEVVAEAATPEPVVEEAAPEKPATKSKKTKAAAAEPAAEPVPEPAPEPVIEAAAEPAPESVPVPEPVAEAAPEPAPAPAVEMPADPNAKMTPEQIAALIAAAGN